MIDKDYAKEIILAYACCSYANNKNKICTTLCPLKDKECENVVINEEIILEALKTLKGDREL